MKHLMIAAITALIATAAAAQQQQQQPPISTPCTYTQVQMPDGRWMTCVSCGTFTSCS